MSGISNRPKKPFNAREHFNAKTAAVCCKCGWTDGHSWSSDFLMSGGYAPTGFCCRWCAFPDLYDLAEKPASVEV